MSLDASDVRRLIHKRFNAPAWAVLEEVRNKTGWARTERYADAVAMSLYPSRGLHLHGIEIKVSRSDWLRELENPLKSVPIQRFCDYWWIVTGNKEIVDIGELPPTWGLLVADKKGTKLITRRQAPKLDAEPLDRGFIASMLRRASERIAVMESGRNNEFWQKGFDEGVSEGTRQSEYKLSRAQAALERTLDSIRQFEEASGVQIAQYGGRSIGEAVRLVLQHQRKHGGRKAVLRRAIEAFELQLQSMKTMEQCLDLLEQQDLASGDPPSG